MERAVQSRQNEYFSARRALTDTRASVQQPVDFSLYRKSSCACGGGCPACQGNSGNLKISQPNDPAEIEADQIADKVMRMPISEPVGPQYVAKSSPDSIDLSKIHRKCDACEDDDEVSVQRKEAFAAAAPTPPLDGTPPSIKNVINSGGRPLDHESRSFFEPRFGRDFSNVRVHSGVAAEQSARDVSARAYTVGQNIVFGPGSFAPRTREGRRLLAHELAHVVQQNTSYSVPRIIQRSPDNQPVDSGTGVPETLLLHSTVYWPKTRDSEEKIRMLAANPDHAHSSWMGLPLQEQTLVAVYMARFYGMTFARQFVALHKAAKPPEAGFQQVGSDIPSAQLTARGFQFAGTQAQMNVEIWFHPSGFRLHRLQAAEPVEKTPTSERVPVTGGQTGKKEERPKSQEPPVTEVNDVTRLTKKWQELSPRLWKALEVYETDTADVLANPPGEDRARLQAHWAIFYAFLDLEKELWELLKQAKAVDMGLADEINSERRAIDREFDGISK